jgi:heme-degrading monooxygenase HmoA
MPATTPTPPYYAVIFTSIRTEGDNGYGEMAKQMDELAKQQPGYLGIESAREEIGITVSYWKDLESIAAWKKQADHLVAQQTGIKEWYAAYKVRICLVEREYGFEKEAL